MELTEVKGIGPATAIKLKTAGINTAEDLANASLEDIVSAGIRKPTATKIVTNAKEVVGTSPEPKKSEEKPKKAPKQTSIKLKAKEDKGEIRAIKIPISYVKGVGPKTRNILEEANITFAQDLAKVNAEELIELGIAKATANKIIANAVEQVGVLPSEEKPPKKVETKVEKKEEPKPPKEKAKPTKPKAKKEKPEPVTEHARSPVPQGIPTKKKRGIQVRKVDLDEDEPTEAVEKPAGWGVKAKELSQDEIQKRKERQAEIAKSRRITRQIPVRLIPVKAVITDTKDKGLKPEKVVKKKKKVKLSKKKDKIAVEYFVHSDIHPPVLDSRNRGISGKTGVSKPRIILERDTKLGKISSHRRSRRVVNQTQVILKLENGFKPDQLVGQKVYFIYPDTEVKVPGTIAKRFGKASSGKVLVYFKRGIRREGLNQAVYIK